MECNLCLGHAELDPHVGVGGIEEVHTCIRPAATDIPAMGAVARGQATESQSCGGTEALRHISPTPHYSSATSFFTVRRLRAVVSGGNCFQNAGVSLVFETPSGSDW